MRFRVDKTGLLFTGTILDGLVRNNNYGTVVIGRTFEMITTCIFKGSRLLKQAAIDGRSPDAYNSEYGFFVESKACAVGSHYLLNVHQVRHLHTKHCYYLFFRYDLRHPLKGKQTVRDLINKLTQSLYSVCCLDSQNVEEICLEWGHTRPDVRVYANGVMYRREYYVIPGRAMDKLSVLAPSIKKKASFMYDGEAFSTNSFDFVDLRKPVPF